VFCFAALLATDVTSFCNRALSDDQRQVVHATCNFANDNTRSNINLLATPSAYNIPRSEAVSTSDLLYLTIEQSIAQPNYTRRSAVVDVIAGTRNDSRSARSKTQQIIPGKTVRDSAFFSKARYHSPPEP